MSDSKPNEKKRPRDESRFLSTMTFATLGGSSNNCDCDECGLTCVMPKDISEAVEEHKRQMLLYNNVSSIICQERSLIFRHEGLSIWKLVLPPGANPLTEYGNSHRFVLVDYMPENRVVKAIGKGILGSGSEESSRVQVNWKEKRGYFYRSNGGKALGWVNENIPCDNTLNIGDTDNDVVVFMIKATDECLEGWKKTNKKDDNRNDSIDDISSSIIPAWTHIILKLMTSYVDADKEENEESDKRGEDNIIMSVEDVKSIQKVMEEFINC